MKDSQSREIEPGDYFAYAVRDGNSSAMNFGRVLEVTNDLPKCVTVTLSWNEDWKVSQRAQTLCDSSRFLVIPHEVLSSELLALIDESVSSRGFSF